MAVKKPIRKPKKKPANKVAAVRRTESGERLRKLSRKQRSHKLKSQQKAKNIIPAWFILAHSLSHLYRNKKLFLGILFVYGFLYILLVKGISANFQLGNLRQTLSDTFGGNQGSLKTGFALYGLLLGSAGNGNTDMSGVYQTLLVLIVSLALIWALRQTYSGTTKLRIRDAFYKSTGQLIPILLVFLYMIVQSLPALVVGSLYNVVSSNGSLVTLPERVVAILIVVLGIFWTFYLLSASIFALYIVTLPNATPWSSLKAAKKLVKFRRGPIIRKVIFLPTVLLLFSAIILIPLIIFLAPAAEVLFVLFTVAVLGVVHSYFYSLYRSML
jgi:hypothetical protein